MYSAGDYMCGGAWILFIGVLCILGNGMNKEEGAGWRIAGWLIGGIAVIAGGSMLLGGLGVIPL